MVQNKSLNFTKAVPKDTYPVPGEHTKLETSEIDLDQTLENGAILVKTKVSLLLLRSLETSAAAKRGPLLASQLHLRISRFRRNFC